MSKNILFTNFKFQCKEDEKNCTEEELPMVICLNNFKIRGHHKHYFVTHSLPGSTNRTKYKLSKADCDAIKGIGELMENRSCSDLSLPPLPSSTSPTLDSFRVEKLLYCTKQYNCVDSLERCSLPSSVKLIFNTMKKYHSKTISLVVKMLTRKAGAKQQRYHALHSHFFESPGNNPQENGPYYVIIALDETKCWFGHTGTPKRKRTRNRADEASVNQTEYSISEKMLNAGDIVVARGDCLFADSAHPGGPDSSLLIMIMGTSFSPEELFVFDIELKISRPYCQEYTEVVQQMSPPEEDLFQSTSSQVLPSSNQDNDPRAPSDQLLQSNATADTAQPTRYCFVCHTVPTVVSCTNCSGVHYCSFECRHVHYRFHRLCCSTLKVALTKTMFVNYQCLPDFCLRVDDQEHLHFSADGINVTPEAMCYP